jgi:predicted PurR-regulated permease PerM
MTEPLRKSDPPAATSPVPITAPPPAAASSPDERGYPFTDRRRRTVGWRTKDVLRAAALVIAMYVGIRLIWFANPLFLTAFLGILFGLAVSAGVDHLQRFRIPRGVGAPLIVLTFIGLLIGFGAWVAPTVREQSVELRRRLPESLDRLEGWIDQHRGGLLSTLLGGAAVEARRDSALTSGGRPPAAGATTGAAPSPQRTPADTATATPSLRERISQQLSGATRYLFPFLSSTLAVLGGLLIILFLSIYIGADPELYHRGLMLLFPRRSRDRAGEVLSAMAAVLRRWLVTQLIAMLAIGTVTTIALLVLRVKAAFALGILAGLLEFIPTVGPILSALPAIAMGFLDSPEKALYVAIAFWGIQFAENHLLIPLLMKGGVDVPPALTILGQALMAIVFGFLGLMCAVPLLAAAMVAVKMLYVEGVVGERVPVTNKDPAKDAAPA